MQRKTEKVSGYNTDLFSFEEAVNYTLEQMKNDVSMQIITVNPEMIELAEKNAEFSEILKNAELVIPDGFGIKLALKLKGINQEQVRGIDFSKKLLEHCEKNNFNVALIGAKEDILTKAVANLKSELPDLSVCYARNGYFSADEEEFIINELKKSMPKLVLVALGAPKQEIFIKKCKKFLNTTAFIGVGGSFDVWSGEVKRAPKFFQITGFEWLYRTISQPQRFKRIYKTLPIFLFKAIIEALSHRS